MDTYQQTRPIQKRGCLEKVYCELRFDIEVISLFQVEGKTSLFLIPLYPNGIDNCYFWSMFSF